MREIFFRKFLFLETYRRRTVGEKEMYGTQDTRNECVSVCMWQTGACKRVRERDSECVCMWEKKEREGVKESVYMCMWERERVCVCVCAFARARARKWERERDDPIKLIIFHGRESRNVTSFNLLKITCSEEETRFFSNQTWFRKKIW